MADGQAENASQECKRRKFNETNTAHNNDVPQISPHEDLQEQVEIDSNHDHYRFAHDLLEMVLDIRNELNHDVQHNLPDPPNYLFTAEHASIAQNYLHTHSKVLIAKIHQSMNSSHDFDNYKKCRNLLVSESKNGKYTKEAFIKACASIGYAAAHFIHYIDFYCGALDDALTFIAKWVKDILKRGTIENSSW